MQQSMRLVWVILIVLTVLDRTALCQQSSGQCAMQCNDLRTEVLTLAMCREAKLTLPRPKVGDFCSTAMEQGFSDACVAICMGETPVNRVAQTCRAASIEMPRPTVRKWCEHGYHQAYNKAVGDLKNHFRQARADSELKSRREAEQAEEIAKQKAETEKEEEVAKDEKSSIQSENVIAEDKREVVASIPIELNDTPLTITLHKGENAEDAVVSFCRQNAPEEMAACIRHVLPSVLEGIEDGGISSASRPAAQAEDGGKNVEQVTAAPVPTAAVP